MLFNEIIDENAVSDRTQRNHARRILRNIADRLLDVEPRKAVWTTYRGRKREPVELPLGWTTLIANILIVGAVMLALSGARHRV